MFEYNKQSDFTSQAAGFAMQKSQLNAYAKTTIANRGSVDSEVQKIADSLNSDDVDAAQKNFNTFLSHIDQSKLNSKTAKDMIKLRDALEKGNIEDSKKAMIDMQKDLKQIYGAYDASKAYNQKQSQIGINIAEHSTDSYA
jgi:transposase